MRYLVLLLVLYPVALIAQPSTHSPAAEFAALPGIKSIDFSPDGKKLVMLRAFEETYHAVVLDLEKQSSSLVLASDPDAFLFDWCRFANDERVICRTRSYGKLVAGMTDARFRWYRDGRTTFYRLIAVNTDGSNALQLVEPPRNNQPGRDLEWNAPDQSRIVSWLPGDKHHILVQLARDDRIYPSVYKLNINNNRLKRVREFRKPILNWVSDKRGNLVMAAGLADGRDPMAVSLLDGWEELDISHEKGVNPPEVLGVSGDGQSVFIAANSGQDTVGLYRFDIRAGKLAQTLFHDPDFDFDPTLAAAGWVQDAVSGQPLYAAYFTDRLTHVWFDETMKATYEAVSNALPGKPSLVSIATFDRSRSRFVFYAEGNGTPPTLYYFDSKKRELKPIARDFGGIGSIVGLQSVQFEARDGAKIPAYLALPQGAGKGPFPTVILPHGGPYFRDTDIFDPWTQLFVARGYAVLRPNFRGSSGYGDHFMSAGFNQWGLRMQDDVIDGLDWMIDEGYTDPKRVCIVGGSYGGYVALVAAYKTPDRFRCAVSFAGVADLEEQESNRRNTYFGKFATGQIQGGNLREQNSPVLHAAEFGVPLLVVQGDLDRSVMVEQARTLILALQNAQKPYTYIEQAGGDHFLSRQGQRTEFFEAMDQFLQQHLWGEGP